MALAGSAGEAEVCPAAHPTEPRKGFAALQSTQYSGVKSPSRTPIRVRPPTALSALPMHRSHPLLAGLVAFGLALIFGLTKAQEKTPEVEAMQKLAEAGDGPAALASVERLLASKPNDPALRFVKGVLLTDAQRSADAMLIFERLTQDYPDLPEPYNNLAVIYAAQGDYERARMALNAALRANPRYAVAEVNLGDVHLRLAQQSYQRALGLDARDTGLPAKLTALRRLTSTEPRPAPP